MKTSPKGFISPLLLALVAVLLIGGGAYVYVQNKQVDQPTIAQTAGWKTFSTTTASLDDYGPIGDNPSPQLTSFSFQYPSDWSVCEKVSLDTEYVTVSDNCSSNGGKPFRFPTNYFQVRNVGALEDSSLTDIGWKTIESDSTNGPEPMRAIYFQSKNITLVLVGANLDTQSTLDRIALTFKFTPSTAQTPSSRSIKDVRKGDTFGDLTVKDVGYATSSISAGKEYVSSAWAHFSGNIILSGKVYRSNIDTPNPICVIIDAKDADKIPRFKEGFTEGSRSTWFCFSNPQSALPAIFRNLQTNPNEGIPVTIEINNYQQIVASEKDAPDTASFVRIVQ